MKKKVLTFIILFVLCRVNTGLCQEYLTLEQLKQQTPPRWVETYQDRYGRSTEVDIDIQIHGNTDAAIYKLKLPYNQEIRCSNNNPYDSVENVRRKGGRRTHIYTSFGEKIDVYFPYGKDYGNNMTPSEMYAFLGERLANEGIDLEEFECTYPAQFDVLCNLSQSDGHTIASAFYQKVCVEQVQMGALDITKSSMGALTSFNDDLNLLSLPYLFKSEDHLWAVMNTEIGQNLLDSMESKGLVGLCWLDAGSRCFYATKPLNTVEDFKNVKFRVMQSSIYQDTVSALGAIPISMSGSEVYSALQTGLVDGAENNIPRIIDMSHNELCKYLILDRHNIMPEMVIVSASTWNRLDEADRTILKECAANLQANMIAAWGETEQAALDTLAAGGMIITEPDAELLTALREAEQPVYDQYGAAYADLVEQIENIQY